jgi:hypothetical protein
MSRRDDPGCRFICFDQALYEPGELVQFFGFEGFEGSRWAEQDCVSGCDGSVTGGGEGDQSATSVVRVKLTFDQAMDLEFVNDERCVWSVEAVGFGELSERQGSVPELEKNLSSPGTEAEPEGIRKIIMAVVRVDELLHEGPGLLSVVDELARVSAGFCVRWRSHHGTLAPR